jgi:hypothetical protein
VKTRLTRIAVLAASALALVASSDLWAGRGNGGGHSGRAHASGARPHHHSRAFVGGTFFFGAPLYPYPSRYYPYPYPYLGAAQGPVPTTYIEQYRGTPTPDTQDWIVCPTSGGTYPNVTECPGGWARVVENPAAPSAAVN